VTHQSADFSQLSLERYDRSLALQEDKADSNSFDFEALVLERVSAFAARTFRELCF